MKTVKGTADIDFAKNEKIGYEATIIDITSMGNEEKGSPIRGFLMFEGSGETKPFVSWKFELAEPFKEAVNTIEIFDLEGIGGLYNGHEQLRVGDGGPAGRDSVRKVLKIIDMAEIKREFEAILNTYVKTELVREMADLLVLANPKFFTWPAATSVHHAFKGGLAVHSLNVTKHAIHNWEMYGEEGRLDIEVMIVGAMMHDIGKLHEYNEDGSRTLKGNIISHLVDGAERVTDFMAARGLNANDNPQVLMIKHIILSHHEKREFGSPNEPNTLEAFLVARADALDSAVEGILSELEKTEPNTFSDRVRASNGGRYLKWR